MAGHSRVSNDPPTSVSILRNRSFDNFQRRYEDPEELSEACAQYFKWVEENPLIEHKAFSYEGEITMAEVPRMRAATIRGMCLFIGVSNQTWVGWREQGEHHRPELSSVIRAVEDMIHDQKFTGAAAGLLNAGIITRDLGLVDRQEQTGNVTVQIDRGDADL